MNILIVEDTDLVARLLKKQIERWGHTAVLAYTGENALACINTTVFDLILLDVFLPDTVAYELIPKIKLALSGIPIITMTGYSSKDVEQKVRSQGILYYMVKPVDLAELKSIILHLQNKNGNQTTPV